MLNELFTFPIFMIDGDNEEKKLERKMKDEELLGDAEDEELDIIYGEAEYPYWDFIGIEDRWLPRDESLKKALDGKFEACAVRFLHAGQLLVPWSRKKFKTEFTKFAEEYEAANPRSDRKPTELKIMTLTPEQFEKATKDGDK